VAIHDPNDNTGGHYCQAVTRAENVRPDTPPQDHIAPGTLGSEPEEPVPEAEFDVDLDVGGRFTTESKGKSKSSNKAMECD